LGTDHGTDQKLIQNTNSQTLQVRMVHISNMVFYQMCLILLPVFVFQVSLSLCFEVSSGLWRLLCEHGVPSNPKVLYPTFKIRIH
jgi:hypothetical protein